MRTAGILLHISSLPSPYGIGTLGKEARDFVDFLKRAGQKWWQVLPVGTTSYGDSPYQSFSAFAGNPYFIDPLILAEEGLLKREEIESFSWGEDPQRVDYGLLYRNRYALLRKAHERFREKAPKEYGAFVEKNKDWLPDYALFMALKDAGGGMEWRRFPQALKFRKPEALKAAEESYADGIAFHEMLQFLFFSQWRELKKYANENGIGLIGDIPIYVASDSADVWTDPEEFLLDRNLDMIEVAGCPPDAFSEDGQLWGNPLYRWDVMKENGYRWWVRRLQAVVELFDLIRIDHFRGFESYYAIPAKDETAQNGVWRRGPGAALFSFLKEALGELPIIAENLGFLTEEVQEMLKETGFPGMKVLQFAFDGSGTNWYLPHHYEKNTVCYTGTHDNETTEGWFTKASEKELETARIYGGLNKEEGYSWGMMRLAWTSVSDLAVVPMQDVLSLGSEARMNTPSTRENNWQWRMKAGSLATKETEALAARLAAWMELSGRGQA